MKPKTQKPGVHMIVNTTRYRKQYNELNRKREDYMPLGPDLERGARKCWVVTKEGLNHLDTLSPENPGTLTAYDGRGNRRGTWKIIGYKWTERRDYLTKELMKTPMGVELILDGRLTGPDAIFWDWDRMPGTGCAISKI